MKYRRSSASGTAISLGTNSFEFHARAAPPRPRLRRRIERDRDFSALLNSRPLVDGVAPIRRHAELSVDGHVVCTIEPHALKWR